MVSHLESGTPSSAVSEVDSSGVAKLKVVAVPAISAITARTSMSFPGSLSVCAPRMGRQASEYFCFFTPRTWSMKPKQAASTA